MSTPWSTDVDEFLAHLLASGLLDRDSIQEACSGFDMSKGWDALCSHLIVNGVLSEWQCEKLRNGQFKGFFLDHYRLVGHLSVEEATSTYLADDLSSSRRVALAITPPTIVPLRNGKPRYRVVKVFRGETPLPGTPAYHEYFEKHGQDAMNQAMAMPLVRVVFGLLFACLFFFFVTILLDDFADGLWWNFSLQVVFVLLIGLPILVDIGSVCFFGKSRTPWFRALMRRWEPNS